ncbi:MAG: OsmC family protein [Anaerolineales bacterium]|jgi:putative redox protein|nr:OsmC family protein [Anaerolineales bacterium]
MEAKVTWRGRLTFSGSADSGFEIPLGTDPAVGGDNDGVRPMEMLAIGLAGCTAMDVISILTKKRQDVTQFEVQVHAERAAEHPKVFTGAVIEYFVVGRGVEEEAVVRAIELSAVRYCPAQAMFSKVFPIELKYHIFEDLGDGQRSLVKSGVYTPVQEQV